jgi:hypothetical protein
MPSQLDKVLTEIARYEHPLFEFSAREKGEAVEIVIEMRNKDLGLHTYYYEIHPRDLAHSQFPWTFQRQLYACLHDYIIEMFTLTPQMK